MNKVKLGQIEQEIYEQDLRIAQVKASVATAATHQGKKAVTFASPPQQASSPSPLREKKENTTPVAAAVAPAGVGESPPAQEYRPWGAGLPKLMVTSISLSCMLLNAPAQIHRRRAGLTMSRVPANAPPRDAIEFFYFEDF